MAKSLLFIVYSLLCTVYVQAQTFQSLKVGNSSPINASAILEVQGTTGAFLVPRMTTTQKNAISNPTSGDVVYDTTLNAFSGYQNGSWAGLAGNPVWGTITGTLSNQSDLQNALNLKANLASPTFTGTVTAPTFSGALSGNATTATSLAGGALGAVPYQGSSGNTSFLSGNTTSTVEYLQSTGSGGVATAPVWAQAAFSQLSGNLANSQLPTAETWPSSGTVQAITPNQYGVLLSGSGATASVLSPSSSTAYPLISGGTSANPSWGLLSVAGGGTESSTALVQYGVKYAASTTAEATTAAGTANYPLVANSSAAPTFQQLSLTAGVTGTLPYGNGGTGQSSAFTQYGACYAGSTSALSTSSAGTTGNPFVSGSPPSFSSGPTLASIIDTSNVLNIEDSTTNSKVLAINVSGNSSSVTTTLKPTSTASEIIQLPNVTATDTLASLGLAQTFSAVQTFTNAPVFSSVTASQLLNVNSSKSLTSIAYAITPAASTIPELDTNKNMNANSFVPLSQSVATAAGTTTLTVSSPMFTNFTGTTTQNLVLPAVSTLALGQAYVIADNSTGVVTVESSGANTIQAMAAGTVGYFVANATTGTSASVWNYLYSGGTPTFSGLTQYGAMYASTTTAIASTAVGTTGQWLAATTSGAPSFKSFTAPSIQQFTSGSGTYTTPTSPGPLYIRVRIVGGGGGGSGSGTASSSSNGGTGGNSTFGTSLFTANGGVGGVWNSNAGAGGTATLNSGPLGFALQGGSGSTGGYVANSTTGGEFAGGSGASSPFGGAGGGGYISSAGNAAITNSGSGGGGGGSGSSSGSVSGNGGGSGGFIDAIITSPSASYSYAVGAAGTAGGAGTNGYAGGAGGSGYIIVEQYYQ